MSIFLPDGTLRGVNNVISMAFFHDCLPHLTLAPALSEDIRFCVDAEVDTLDLRGKSDTASEQLKTLVDRITREQVDQSDDHSAYRARLAELETLLRKA